MNGDDKGCIITITEENGFRRKKEARMGLANRIKFETTVIDDIIRIPDRYVSKVPPEVRVTLAPATASKIKRGSMAAGALPRGYFSAVNIDTRGFKFNREEANERRASIH
jgi:hypothetical protein